MTAIAVAKVSPAKVTLQQWPVHPDSAQHQIPLMEPHPSGTHRGVGEPRLPLVLRVSRNNICVYHDSREFWRQRPRMPP
jgi:hypothetical protein